ncbi:hypothetical protein LTR95_007761 [Oleoguttula sp. CCFEE 5521]
MTCVLDARKKSELEDVRVEVRRQNMNTDPNLTIPTPLSDRNHRFFKLCYHDSASVQVLCVCYPPGISVVLALQAELARRNLYGTAVWHYPTDSHEEVSGLEELETIPEGLRETRLGLHLEEPEQEYEEDDQMVVEIQTVPEEDDQAEDDQSREEILYDSDEASEYVRTPVRTRRTALEQEQDIAEQPDQPNVPDETLLRRNRARSSGRRERNMRGASTRTSAYEGALRLLNPALFAEPDRQRAQAAAERNGEPSLPYERPSGRRSSGASGYGEREPERVSTHPSAYEGALRLLNPALFAKSKQPNSESADRKRKAAPLQQPGSG